jgi:hypothetical protein
MEFQNKEFKVLKKEQLKIRGIERHEIMLRNF